MELHIVAGFYVFMSFCEFIQMQRFQRSLEFNVTKNLKVSHLSNLIKVVNIYSP